LKRRPLFVFNISQLGKKLFLFSSFSALFSASSCPSFSSSIWSLMLMFSHRCETAAIISSARNRSVPAHAVHIIQADKMRIIGHNNYNHNATAAIVVKILLFVSGTSDFFLALPQSRRVPRALWIIRRRTPDRIGFYINFGITTRTICHLSSSISQYFILSHLTIF